MYCTPLIQAKNVLHTFNSGGVDREAKNVLHTFNSTFDRLGRINTKNH